MDYVTCPLCNKNFSQLTNSHIKWHGLDMPSFISMYPNIVLVSERVRILNQGNSILANSLKDKNIKVNNISAYNINKNKCTICNKDLEYTQRHNTYCSKSCSATHNCTGRHHTIETRLKMSNIAKKSKSHDRPESIRAWAMNRLKRIKPPKIEIHCKHCKIIFHVSKSHAHKIYCSRSCYTKSGNNGGYNPQFYT